MTNLYAHRLRDGSLLLLVGILLVAGRVAAQGSCRSAFADTAVRGELAALGKVAAVPPVWDGYSLSKHPLLLIADSMFSGTSRSPVCAAIWRAGTSLEIIELVERPRLSTPLYGMINLPPYPALDGGSGNSVSGALAATLVAHPSTAALLASRGIARVVVLPVPMDFGRLGGLGATLRQARVDPAMMQADFAVHESFHLHVQFPTWLGQPGVYSWPAWDRQPDRRELRERCYNGSPDIAAALREEHAALLAAFDALDADRAGFGRDAALAHSRRFVALRNARRAMSDTVRVQQDHRRISCTLAEDLLELEEGVPQWVGHFTTVRAGLTTRTVKRGSYAQLQPEAFYQFGPLQLWVLEGLLEPSLLRDLTTRLARSTSPDDSATVYRAFEHYTRDLTSVAK